MKNKSFFFLICVLCLSQASDPDCVDRLLHCVKSATPMFSVSLASWFLNILLSAVFGTVRIWATTLKDVDRILRKLIG